MAHGAYLSVTAQKQGKIKGPVTLPGRKDTIQVFGGFHEIISPRDMSSGLPTGQRMHKPLTLIKDIDCSSPLLLNSLVTNENLKEVVLQLWSQDRGGRDAAFYTITLINANISAYKLLLSYDGSPESARHPEREELTFTYQKISWTWEHGAISASDDWEVRI
ncbi:MAG: type VI secretion system tube protein Hcp [Chlorobiaceae bacterium]|nr:type VI secretion system tube protein Hcp [Chlorobiaceae bacterium]